MYVDPIGARLAVRRITWSLESPGRGVLELEVYSDPPRPKRGGSLVALEVVEDRELRVVGVKVVGRDAALDGVCVVSLSDEVGMEIMYLEIEAAALRIVSSSD